MVDRNRRKELVSDYKQTPREAGVYRIVNTENGRALIGSSTNMNSVRSKLEFARSTHSYGVFGYQLKDDMRQYGIDSFTLEILELLDVKPEMTDAQVRSDLNTLEQLWRERYAPDSLY